MDTVRTSGPPGTGLLVRTAGRAADLDPAERLLASPQMQHLRGSVKQNVPVYVHQRVYEGLKDLLLSGTVACGERLPTPGQLAGFLHVGHQTVRKAFRRLLDEGIVRPGPRRGTFTVASPRA